MAATSVACTTEGRPPDATPTSAAAFVEPAHWRGRQNSYLEFASARVDPTSAVGLIAAAELAQRRDAPLDTTGVTVGSLQGSFDKIDTFEDTADIDLVYLINLWEGYRDDLPDDVVEAIEERMRSFKYWYTDPSPRHR